MGDPHCSAARHTTRENQSYEVLPGTVDPFISETMIDARFMIPGVDKKLAERSISGWW